MIDSTLAGDKVDEGATRTTEPVVDRDACGERQEALSDAGAQVGQCAGAVALEGEDVLAGPKDRLDPLTDLREPRAGLRLVAARWPQDRRPELGRLKRELATGVALVADDRLAATALGPGQELQRRPRARGAWAR